MAINLSNLLKELKQPPEIHRAILIETLLFKYSMTFEHTMHFIKRVRPVLDEIFHGNYSNQAEALNYIFKSYNLDDLSTQNYQNDVVNIYQVRQKVILLVLKLVDLGIFDPIALVPVCLDKIKQHLVSN